MAVLTWDQAGERYYETGVDRGVLYIPNEGGVYDDGVAWNGLTAVTESPSGAEATPQYADNIKYLNLFSAEQFGATLEAFTYPDEFAQFDGLGVPESGVTVGQQPRKTFGLSYRTKVGNDLEGNDKGYKLHLVYGATAAPSEKAFKTVNDSPEAIAFSWVISTVAVPVTNYSPTSLITIDSTKVASADLTELENFLYGTAGTDPSLPTPDAVLAIFSGTLTEVVPGIPTFVQGTHTLTIPSTANVKYYIDGVLQTAGAQVITGDVVVTARPDPGYKFPEVSDDDWFFDYA